MASYSIVRLLCFQAEDGIRDLVRSRGLGDVYKRQVHRRRIQFVTQAQVQRQLVGGAPVFVHKKVVRGTCLLYTSDAADERSSVDLGGRRIIKKKTSVSKLCEPTRNSENAAYASKRMTAST